MSKYGVFSGPHFPVFGPEKTTYLETFHAVKFQKGSKVAKILMYKSFKKTGTSYKEKVLYTDNRGKNSVDKAKKSTSKF